jgi:hypothetical protein
MAWISERHAFRQSSLTGVETCRTCGRRESDSIHDETVKRDDDATREAELLREAQREEGFTRA